MAHMYTSIPNSSGDNGRFLKKKCLQLQNFTIDNLGDFNVDLCEIKIVVGDAGTGPGDRQGCVCNFGEG